MKDRLLKFLKQENLSATKFADEIGVQRSSISHILSGRNKPSYDFIYKTLDKYSNLSADWLISGKGGMYKDEIQHITPKPQEQGLFAGSDKVSEKSPDEERKSQNVKESRETDFKEPQITGRKTFSTGKSTEKVLIFYSDGTFREYSPGE